MRTTIPAAAMLVLCHGTHVLLLKRSDTVDSWPGHWAFPGGKLEDNEMMRAAAIRETEEEVGITLHPKDIKKETLIMLQTNQGVKLVYFGFVESYNNIPEIQEHHLATDLAWFPITELPTPMIPHHINGLQSLLTGINYSEISMISESPSF